MVLVLAWFGCGGGREASPLPQDIAGRKLPSGEEIGSRRAASMALVVQAQDALKHRRKDPARAWLESAITLDPQNPYPYHLLGLFAFDGNDTSEAEALFQKAAVLYQNEGDWEVEAYLLLGVCAERRRHWAAARDAFAHVLRLSPDLSRAESGLAKAKRNLKE
jgi:tetratricopeptide (TPR) repeat protein